ncbi:Protein of unknown function [Pyronema omphalodes CBS 100304]|uniref:Uncharacterized protein n=1 Tax=Pyronema omphalodes (strain CBS 100304) TaxID=1076935 RepID=U4LT20_PYROM|nr:Protein of unknown function [Pyronema omphalodes CBS 100304]
MLGRNLCLAVVGIQGAPGQSKISRNRDRTQFTPQTFAATLLKHQYLGAFATRRLKPKYCKALEITPPEREYCSRYSVGKERSKNNGPLFLVVQDCHRWMEKSLLGSEHDENVKLKEDVQAMNSKVQPGVLQGLVMVDLM